jgi:hypothetical protein
MLAGLGGPRRVTVGLPRLLVVAEDDGAAAADVVLGGGEEYDEEKLGGRGGVAVPGTPDEPGSGPAEGP